MSAHEIVHIELPATDGSEASQFYSNVFGWKRQSFAGEPYDYWMFQPEGGPGGGFNPVGDEGVIPTKPGDVLLYIDTDNIEDSLSKVESEGGKTLIPRKEITGMGWYAIFTDPTGNRVGLFQGSPAA
jgi:predicted enzyme related to lactoylglutathione lyase